MEGCRGGVGLGELELLWREECEILLLDRKGTGWRRGRLGLTLAGRKCPIMSESFCVGGPVGGALPGGGGGGLLVMVDKLVREAELDIERYSA